MTLSEEVNEIVAGCLFKEDELPENGEPPEGAVIVKGIMRSFGFHPERLSDNKQRIAGILRQMPDMFHKQSGGGWSFLNLCETANGEHWAEQSTMEELCVLAIGTDQGSFLMNEFRETLPGGMPYVVFDCPA